MNWGLILKSPAPQLAGKKYNDIDVKMHLRAEGGNRCVYCSINESVIGGYQFFWVEHHKPQSVDSSLENDLNNLFYSCQICNRFKSNDWPCDPTDDYSVSSYPNPTKVDYADLFSQSPDNGILEGTYMASRCMIERIFLNRPQLILERRRVLLTQKHSALISSGAAAITKLQLKNDTASKQILSDMAQVGNKLQELLVKLQSIPPYEPIDVIRQ